MATVQNRLPDLVATCEFSLTLGDRLEAFKRTSGATFKIHRQDG